MTETQQVVAILVGIATLVAGFYAWLKWMRPLVRTASAVGDTILGREELRDRSGAVIQPAVPSMAVQVAALTEAVKSLADVSRRMDHLEAVQVVQGNVQVEQAAQIAELEARQGR